jgi:NAD(P)-dependent dehydrogenase (short-subunit alcohol dehydrogenase family)
MTAWAIKTVGDDVFEAVQPSGTDLLINVPSLVFPLPCTFYAKSMTTSPGRFGMPHDIAGITLFLASPASAHVTGTHTLLDGGARYHTAGSTASTKL